MRGNRERKMQLIALVVLLTIFLLFADLLFFGYFFISKRYAFLSRQSGDYGAFT
ncbi:hypothetical protein HMPREF9624_01983 [Oribacterium asaccharolyticum ACB7]|uniref:Uncharacterized protein n=1 Tax=Oribacterium asaccharolyticum ACB7 TaxID=796944 RepID=G9WSB7_9FIRM|nr:hypothetical protein HMPREF9624_01983 [Oribacterium asaccharolyticum ACB7]